MSSKERKSQKKSKRNLREKERSKKRDREIREANSLKNIQETGTQLKPFFRELGCDLQFYDFLDCYQTEYERIEREALSNFPSLIGIHQVSSATLDQTDWNQLGYGHLEPVELTIDERHADYGSLGGDANMRGCAKFFKDKTGRLQSVILIQKAAKRSRMGADLQYATKIAALTHEVGHVRDAEQNGVLHFDDKIDIIEAEVVAHLYALEFMSGRHLRQSYDMLYDALASCCRSGWLSS